MASSQHSLIRRQIIKTRIPVSLLILASAMLAWAHYSSLPPTLIIPSPIMPSPNAFDEFARAAALSKNNDSVVYAIDAYHSPHPTDPNDHHYSQSEKSALLLQNAEALRTLRQGLAHQYLNPPIRSFMAQTRYYLDDSSLTRLLRLESLVQAGRNDWRGAVNSDLDAVQLGVALSHGSPLMGLRRGIDCQDTGRMTVWPVMKHLTAPQARAAARRLETVAAGQADFNDILQEDLWQTQAGLREMMRSPHWRDQYRQMDPCRSAGQERVLQVRLALMTKRSLLNAYTQIFQEAQTRAHSPYHTSRASPPPFLEPITEDLTDSLQELWFLDTANRTQNSLLATAFALQAYQRDYGAYPASITLLVPAYLSRLPADPFDAGRPLHYRRSKSVYVLYSIGPDGRDDGGTPVVNLAFPTKSIETPNPRYVVDSSSRGDFVAGITMDQPLRGSM